MAVNFMDSLKENFYENILKEIEHLDISMLINNVGISGGIIFH
eukprot:CAMPEP_0114580424 /NCGR_PEP_ID=MMETSP0125-20121206/4716_1 /TAXON_ID=485358 ORGANISM="Aristerostoma sp., Strain ATCC 50986" /NCGR_SAMPLE_ID=MMETSP0125 /ASSEMBLY_ACC=CAM_ASM_000245 /LENGTH=42 /DNA_ID= /DNA_START= /DNA_END= /DNA_ORIENTATION=